MQSQIDVRAVPIPQGLADVAGAHHLFIVYTGTDGVSMFLRGGPFNPKLGPGEEDSMGYKGIQCTWGKYEPGTIDYSTTALSVTAAKGYDRGSYDRMVGVCQVINFRGFGYRVTGPNSNTVARTLLAALGIPPKKPDVFTPGWDLAPLVN